MVRGSPRHSESNGGVERVNQTIQKKLGAWMSENKSKHWSVGCKIAQWRYNTQVHQTLRGEIVPIISLSVNILMSAYPICPYRQRYSRIWSRKLS